jgi:methyl-accepting chemotaxis protein
MNSLSVGARISLVLGSVILLATLGGLFALHQLSSLNSNARIMVEHDFRVAELLHAIRGAQTEMRVYRERAALLATVDDGDDALRQELQRVIDLWRASAAQTGERITELENAASEYSAVAADPLRRALWSELRGNARQTNEALEEISTLVTEEMDQRQRGDRQAEFSINSRLLDTRLRFDALVDRGLGLALQLMDRNQAFTQEIYDTARIALGVVFLLSALFALALGVLLHRFIVSQLARLLQALERLADGDLTHRVGLVGGHEFARLGQALDHSVASLNALIRGTRSSVGTLTAAVAELQAAAQQQAASTSEQGASIQQITSTCEEISQSGAQVAAQARRYADESESVAQGSAHGLKAVEEGARAMAALREQAEAVAGNIVQLTEKAQSIGEVTNTVNEIAERSKLLAFNAAIEAAAAGEHGETFAVVADEIKNLAGEAKQSTVEVRRILGDIQQGIARSVMLTEEAVKRADAGDAQTRAAAKSMSDLVASVNHSIDTFQQIVAASGQQQLGIEQVTAAVQNIRTASEQIAVGTRDLSRAVEDLASMGDALSDSVERFRV